jgi:hypothetical protein
MAKGNRLSCGSGKVAHHPKMNRLDIFRFSAEIPPLLFIKQELNLGCVFAEKRKNGGETQVGWRFGADDPRGEIVLGWTRMGIYSFPSER